MWLGYTQSLRPTQSGLTLNMDMAATAFLEVQPVIDYLLRAINFRSPEQFANASPQIIRKAARAIAGIKARLLPLPLCLLFKQSILSSPQCPQCFCADM